MKEGSVGYIYHDNMVKSVRFKYFLHDDGGYERNQYIQIPEGYGFESYDCMFDTREECVSNQRTKLLREIGNL